MSVINFSRGAHKYDNKPEQLLAFGFNDFVDMIDKDRSPSKGLAYICAELSSGPHYQEPEKFPGYP